MKYAVISEGFRAMSMRGFQKKGNFRNDAERLYKFLNLNSDNINEIMPQIGLRLALGETITVHRITNSVSKKINHVKIETLPNDYPLFLKTPFLIEAKPYEYLFDDIYAIGGYIDDFEHFHFFAYVNNGCLVCHEEKPFSNNMLLSSIIFKNDDDPYQVQNYQNKKRDVLRYITILGLMLEAEKSPVIIDSGTKKSKKQSKRKKRQNELSDWIERRIYIDVNYLKKKHEKIPVVLDKENKILKDIFVQGFLRRQHYGQKNELMKWIYVEGFETSRWENKGDKRITIDTRKK